MRLTSVRWFSLVIFSIVLVINNPLFADIKVDYNQTTRKMTITITDGEDVVITKDPTTGGLAINGI